MIRKPTSYNTICMKYLLVMCHTDGIDIGKKRTLPLIITETTKILFFLLILYYTKLYSARCFYKTYKSAKIK